MAKMNLLQVPNPGANRRNFLTALGLATGFFLALPAIAKIPPSTRKVWEPDGSGRRARIGLSTPDNDTIPERAIVVTAGLEEDLGRPVLTANQLAFWYALRLAGAEAEIDGYDQVFRKSQDRN
jgi:hypothetical protein